MTDADITSPDWFKHPTGKIPTGQFCSHCGRYNARNSTTTMLVINNQNQVLLIKRKRNPAAGWWAMPGGYLDWNETLADCAKRELKEETGLEANEAKLLGVYDALDRDKDGRQNIDHCYISKLTNDQALTPNAEEVSDIKFFSPEKLPDKIAFDHRQMIEDYYGRSSNH